ncbi:hypothetical protein ACFC18_26115 [Streptomyces sp. NPDC056121]
MDSAQAAVALVIDRPPPCSGDPDPLDVWTEADRTAAVVSISLVAPRRA